MKSFGEILLISCYELGHQPFALALPLGFLKDAGYNPDAFDIAIDSFDPIRIKRARFVGISVPMHTALRLGMQVAKRIREINPHCHICFYGLYASLNAEYLLNQAADFVIGGEFEIPLVQLVETLEKGIISPIKGVSDKTAIASPYLYHLPFSQPQREHLPDLKNYASLEENGSHRLAGYVETSRGCKHLCLHCPIPPVYEGRFFLIPQELVMEDIRRQVKAGATHITFGDPDFLNGPRHSLKIVRALHQEYPQLTFDFTAKVEHIKKNKEIFPEFSEKGCIFMISAVESLSDIVLKQLKKNHTRKDIYEALYILRSVKIPMRPSLVPFTPWETLDDYIFMLNFVEEQDLIDHIDPVQYTIRLLIPPGSSLLSNPSLTPFLGPLIQENFSYQWFHPDPRMETLQKKAAQEVEEATETEEDPFLTFHRIRELAFSIKENRSPREIQLLPPAFRKRPPRLTESWFCCAEPMENQLRSIQDPII